MPILAHLTTAATALAAGSPQAATVHSPGAELLGAGLPRSGLFLAWVPGPWELALILAVLLLLFGGRKLPELARSMGTSITQFKRGLKQETEAIEGGSESGAEDEEDK